MGILRFLLDLLHPGFWLDAWRLRNEDDNLDLDWTPSDKEEAEIQAQMFTEWRERQLKKGREV